MLLLGIVAVLAG